MLLHTFLVDKFTCTTGLEWIGNIINRDQIVQHNLLRHLILVCIVHTHIDATAAASAAQPAYAIKDGLH
ncbi:hypothetical protein QTP88_018905 [Uroleucon formosanum]